MTTDLARARTNMVENQVRTNDVTDLDVQDAMRAAPRERLCPPGRAGLAYAEARIEYAPGFRLAEPREVSKLLQAIYPRKGERALTIAAPYAAMVLARIGCGVTAREAVGLPLRVREALEAEGVTVMEGDLMASGDAGPFDIVVSEGGVERAPTSWLDALAEDGRLAVVERRGAVGKARLYLRAGASAPARREVFDAGAPMMPGFASAPTFAL